MTADLRQELIELLHTTTLRHVKNYPELVAEMIMVKLELMRVGLSKEILTDLLVKHNVGLWSEVGQGYSGGPLPMSILAEAIIKDLRGEK